MAKLTVAFIGAGGIARGAHLPGFKAIADEVKIVAAADLVPATLKRFATDAGLTDDQCYADYEQMLDKVKPDVVAVCTPNAAHCPATVAAFARGAHVLCEKPVGICADQARQMVAAGKKAGKLLMVGQTLRYFKASAQMKQWVDNGDIGEIYWARAQYLRVRGVPGSLNFVSKDISQGGPIYDIGVHVLDLTLWLMGFPEPVTASAGVYKRIVNRKSPLVPCKPEQYTVPDDSALSLIRFKNGAVISLECSWALNIPKADMNVTVCGEKGGAEWSPATLLTERKGSIERVQSEVFKYPEPAGHTEEIRAFIEAIKKGKPSPVPGEEALITQRILDAIYESGEQGREVVVK